MHYLLVSSIKIELNYRTIQLNYTTNSGIAPNVHHKLEGCGLEQRLIGTLQRKNIL